MTDKKTIELNKTFAAPAAVVFDAIKDGYLLRSTGVKPESFKHDFRAGGEFSLAWAAKAGGTCTGRYLQIDPNEMVKFTWNSHGCESSPKSETVVTVTLTDCGTTTEMRLVHEGLDAGFCYDDHLAGWNYTADDFRVEIDRLKSVV